MGNALIDVLVQAESDALLRELQLPKGSMQLIGPARYRELQQRFASLSPRRTTGGSACNTLLALAHLGAVPGLIAKVGDDEAGRFFAESCRQTFQAPAGCNSYNQFLPVNSIPYFFNNTL